MVGIGRFILPIDSRSFLCSRSCLVKISKNISKNATVKLRDVELPPKPKKPLTSFLLFLKTIRPKLIETQPDMKATELIKVASKEWTNLDPALKEGFQSQYKQNYNQYAIDIKHYNDSLNDSQKLLLEEQKQQSKDRAIALDIKRKMESFNKPKKPANAFIMFLNSKRTDKIPDIPMKEWIHTTTKEWTSMPDEEKKVYMNEATRLMEKYKEDIVKWEQDMINLGHPEIVRRTISKKLPTEARKHKQDRT